MTTAEKRNIARVSKNLLAKAVAVPGFSINIWNDAMGKPFINYSCDSCQFESLYRFKVTEHIDEGVHVWKRPSKRTRKERADKGAVY